MSPSRTEMRPDDPSSGARRARLIIDGDCGFCRTWAARWQRTAHDRFDVVTYQNVADQYPDIPRQAFAEAVQFIDEAGRRTSGAEAALGALSVRRRYALALALYRRLAPVRVAADRSYAFVAGHRQLFSRLTRLAFGSDPTPAGRTRTAALFLRGLAVVYLMAFVSLWVQIDGLIGARGVLPVAHLVTAARAAWGDGGWHQLPMLSWWLPGDATLHVLCAVGVAASIVLAIGWLPQVCLTVAYLAYLSLTNAGQVFMGFQWDALLLETGLLAILLLPLATVRLGDARPSATVWWLLRLLLFKLMLLSGIVKLASGDPSWRALTALFVHFETQPLPTPLSPWAHALPHALLRGATVVLFAIELAVPFLIIAPRRLRAAAIAPLALLQVVILLTGNYGYFNWLTLVLLIVLLDDRMLPGSKRPEAGAGESTAGRRPLVPLVAAVVVLVSTMQIVRPLGWQLPWNGAALALERQLGPWHAVNGYGLFAVMTPERREIVIEGSRDGRDWQPFTFKYKPGPTDRPPPWVAPHQPRLDWQMWFAALGDYRRNPWLGNLCVRLLEGSPPVLALLDGDPFGGEPPRHVRTILYDYDFTERATRAATGQVWTRHRLGAYAPPLSRER